MPKCYFPIILHLKNFFRKNLCPAGRLILPCTCQGKGGNDGSLILNCGNYKLGDANLSRILNYFLPMKNKLGRLNLNYNNLTKVPDEIRQFDHIYSVDLDVNQIRLIESGAFKFPDKVNEKGSSLSLQYNPIDRIEPGAFQGNKYVKVKVLVDALKCVPSIFRSNSNIEFERYCNSYRIGSFPFSIRKHDERC